MTLLVPFDGSALAEAALVRASQFGTAFDEAVLAVGMIPAGDDEYARDHGWIGPDEGFEVDAVASELHSQVTDVCASVDFRYEVIERYASQGTISNRVRRIAKDEDATMVFIGSENAGRLISSLHSVGSAIAADESYDVVIVRHPTDDECREGERPLHRRLLKSDFFLPD